MASEIKKVPRSYSTPAGWRLATFQEVNARRDTIQGQGLLQDWETARLLDGWIGGPRYDFQIRDDFRSCLGYMLVIQVQLSASCNSGDSNPARSIYEDVHLTLKGREVALLLCAQDCNYEVVYWLLNFWEKTDLFNPLDVGKRIPFSNSSKFVDMNRSICEMGRVLGEERLASEKALRKKFSRESVKEVMISMGKSCWNKFSQEHKKILGHAFLDRIDGSSRFVSENEECSKVNWFHEFSSQGNESDAIWNFLWYIMSSHTLASMVYTNLCLLLKQWENEGSQTVNRRGFIMSTAILHILSRCEKFEFLGILTQACKDAEGDDRHCLNDLLKNASLACNVETGEYDVLNKILIYAVESCNNSVMKKVLEWGAKPEANVRPGKQNMALYYAIRHRKNEIVRSLFEKCHSKETFVCEAFDKGMTALHWACERNDPEVSICRMILEYGGKPDVPDNRGRLPLHYAVERGMRDVIDVLVGGGDSDTVQGQDFNERRANMVTRKDNDDVSPLDMAVNNNNIKLMVKLLSVSPQALETYFHKVDPAKLLREFASQGNMEVVRKLLESGADPLACDEQGRTALIHASMCEDDYIAHKLTELMLKKCTSEDEKKIWVTKQDDMGKTALHVAALRGHKDLCSLLIGIDLGIVKLKDADGRAALFEAVKGGHYNVACLLFNDRSDGSITDCKGLTPLHAAASGGRVRIADFLLKRSKNPKVYLRTTDVFGQTALHKAAEGGHADIIKVLLHWGAHPLLERDCDGRTVLHYFAPTLLTGEDGKEVAELLLKKCGSYENKLLLLWANAAGVGTADQHLSDSPLKNFLLEQKKDITEKLGKENNLLKTAACLGDIDLIKELLSRGAQIGDIIDQNWRTTLSNKDKHTVDTVLEQIQNIAEQTNDQPTTSDKLGRSDFAYGLAALLLNPYLKLPITVGISGSWGLGKSSFMLQTEGILLKTAAQLALLPSEMSSFELSSSEISNSHSFEILEHTEMGRKKYHQIETSIDLLLNDSKLKSNFFQIMKTKIVECWMKIKYTISDKTRKEGYSLHKFLDKYEARYHRIFQSLAAMDSSGMFKLKGQQSVSEIDPPSGESVPAILTVRYNASEYRNESEALMGMAVEITQGMEGIMTDAQWLSTCLRNVWRKQKQIILIEIIFPCLVAVLSAISFTWILWLLLAQYHIKESVELKYASLPLVVVVVWTLAKNVMSTGNSVSAQLMNYMKPLDDTVKLGYQERVVSDITFLKGEVSKKPYCLCTAASYIWHFITGSWVISWLSSKYSRENIGSWIPSANLRTIVFVDDLDRCQESVILQVLSNINLVLAVCEISVVLGMDKDCIQRAIMTRCRKELADKYLRRIIQLPLDLPDPSQIQSKNLLDRHLGVLENQIKEGHSKSETYAEDDSIPEIMNAYSALFSQFERSRRPDSGFFAKMLGPVTPISEANSSAETTVAPPQTQTAEGITLDIQSEDGTREGVSSTETVDAPLQTQPAEGTHGADGTSDQCISDSNLVNSIRELLFVRYSEGEQGAFGHLQLMATGIRKSPREWKILCAYHRLVWYIFIMNNETKHLDRWQVQLITWIFICWEFEENINILVQRWKEIDLLKTYKLESESGPMGPSLRTIVEHCIEKESWIIASIKDEKIAATSNKRDTAKHSKDSENKDPPTQKFKEGAKEKDCTNSKNTDVPECRNTEQMKLKESVNDQMRSVRNVTKGGDCSESSEMAGPENLITVNDKLGEASLMELDSLMLEMPELKDLVNSQQVGKTEKRSDVKKVKLESWRRLKYALGIYDVSMAGIQAFQRFRFYCEAGHLTWPLHPEE